MPTLTVSFLLSLYYYGSTIFMMCFWVWVGGKFAKCNIKFIPSILIGNSIGIISLAVYIWQFVLIPFTQSNSFLSGFSSKFSVTVELISFKIAYIFNPEKVYNGGVIYGRIQVFGKDNSGVVTIGRSQGFGFMNIQQIFGLILMMLIFTVGYIYYKRKLIRSYKQNI